ncbi:MAG: hypothetical protein JNL79_00685 [Myxococcales bacterium]|nr:hypothetical protein [Myxococcales bacterium]
MLSRRVLPLLLAVLGCASNATPTSSAREGALPAPAEALLRRAQRTPRAEGSSLAIATGSTVATVDARGAVRFAGLSFRVVGPATAPRVEGRAVRVGDALLFDQGASLEVLHHLPRPTELAYDLELPPGHALARDGADVVVVDPHRVPVVRVSADAAWDRDGRPIEVHLALQGKRLSIVLPVGARHPVTVDPTFSPTNAPGKLRTGHTATVLGNGQVLLAGGDTSTAELFDPITARFRPTGSMAVSRAGHGAVALRDGRVLIVGGGGATTELYDPTTGTFKAGPSLTTVTGAVSALGLADGKVLVVDGASAPKSARLFDPATDTWATVAQKTGAEGPLVALGTGEILVVGSGGQSELYRPATSDFVAVASPASFASGMRGLSLVDGNALIHGVTGITVVGSLVTLVVETWSYAAATKVFTRRADPAPAEVGATVLPSGYALIAGKNAQFWAPSTATWSAPATLPYDFTGGTATVLPSGAVLLAGGLGGGSAILTATGQPSSGAFTASGNLAFGRVGGRATRLLDGRVLFAGGNPPSGITADGSVNAELFDPVAGTTTTKPLTTARVDAAQVLLASGKVLIAGGQGKSTAELFDPTTGASAATGSLSAVRQGASATLLPDGRALVVGGSGLSTAETYDEKTGTFTALASKTSAPRTGHGAVLLPSGLVMVVSGVDSDLFDPTTSTFSAGPALSVPREGRTATVLADGGVLVAPLGIGFPHDRFVPAKSAFELTEVSGSAFKQSAVAGLPFGRLLVAGGIDSSGEATSAGGFLFEPAAAGGRGAFGPTAVAPFPRNGATLVPLVRGGALFALGDACGEICLGVPSRETAVFDASVVPLAQRPTITTAPASVEPGKPFDLVGTRFFAAGASAPVVAFVPASGQGSITATTTAFTATTMTVVLPATVLRGNGFLHVSSSGVVGPGKLVAVSAATNGVACAVDAECSSSHCVDGVCCDTACTGLCFACTKARKGSGADGTCGAIPPGKDPKDACALFQGAPCASDGECASGICADGVCCDARCDGQCEACTVSGSTGTCVPVLGAPKGTRAACATGTDTCSARTCDGKGRTSCDGFAPTSTSCRAAGCAAGVETLAASCDGAGACPAATTKRCEPFACGEKACLTRCTGDTECAASYRCSNGKCVTGAYCAAPTTLKTPGAADADCSPYLCEGDRCLASCKTSSDCIGGFACSDGLCTSATGAVANDSGCTAAPTGPTTGAVLRALAGLGAVGRRRRTL